jgi:putative nucleotide binding protein
VEEYVRVIDYLPQGIPSGGYSKKEPVCFGVGESEFKLFELVPKAGARITMGDRVYVGEDKSKREQIDHIRKRVGYEDLTSTAQSELEYAVDDIVRANPGRYIRFYNEAGPITMRKHALEELPGLGKKSMDAILKERNVEKFKSFEDLAERVPVVKNPEKLIIERVLMEISENNLKRYIFVSR